MMLTPRETEKLMVYVAAELARKRKARGLRLNVPESVALITEALLEAARDGKTVPQAMELGRQVLTREEVMYGVPDLVTLVQVRRPEDPAPESNGVITLYRFYHNAFLKQWRQNPRKIPAMISKISTMFQRFSINTPAYN